MQLKSMELKGFKSFSHKTQLLFPKGLISIVGPNGSGKSNVLDALRWVLGEQSAKNLRGDKMEDVIFSGTKIHSPMNSCEVEVVFENEDHFLDTPYNEISIRRKAFRNGESQYFLNSKAARLKDIKELLLDSGIGKEGYSIISQGRVDELVNDSSQNRRKIVEEACGIAKFRYKKEEGEKKLLSVKGNLERIQDVYAELERQIRPMEIQSEKALEYLRLKDQLTKSEVNKLLKDRNEINDKLSSLYSLRDEYFLKLSVVSEELNYCVEQKKHREVRVNEIDLETISLREEKDRLYREDIDNKHQISRCEDSILQKTDILTKYNDEFLKNDKYLSAGIMDSSIEEKKLIEAKEQCEKAYFDVSNVEADNLRLESQLDVLESEAEKNLEELSRLKNQENFCLAQQNMFSSQDLSIQNKLQNYNANKEEQLFKGEKIHQEMIKVQTEFKDKQQQVDHMRNQISLLVTQEAKYQSQLRVIQSIESNVQLSLKEVNSQKSVYEEMEHNLDGISKGVKAVLGNPRLKGVCSVISNIITVEQQYEKAIEVALGNAIQNIVVETEEAAEEAIEFLKKNRSGRATFLPLSSLSSTVLNHSDAQSASTVIQCLPKFRPAIDALLGRTLLVENISKAIEFSRKTKHKYRIVTLDGELFHGGGSISGGHFPKQSSILGRKRLIRDLNEKSEKLQVEQSDLQKRRLDIEHKLKELEDKLCRFRQIQDQEETMIRKLEAMFQEATLRLDLWNEEKNKYEKEVYTLEKEHQVLQEAIERNSVELKEVQKNILQLQNNNAALQVSRKKLRLELEKGRSVEKDLKIKVATFDHKIAAIEKEYLRLQQIIIDYQDEKKRLESEVEENQKDITILRKKCSQLLKVQVELSCKIQESETQIQLLMDELGDKKNKVLELNELFQDLERRKYNITEKKYDVENQVSHNEVLLSNYASRLLEDYALTFEEAELLSDEKTNIKLSYIQSLKRSISNLGNINLDAIEEYKKLKERHDLYYEQKQDLLSSLESLENIISRFEREMKKEFKSNFKKIRNQFNFTFSELFGGGEADLILSDDADYLSADIEIHAQPPGKRLRSLNMMSGGEKVLTAIALLFAIVMTRPTPFCFLDEIDGPLDDLNIFRFNRFVKKLSEKVQFMMITHRRGTMEHSDYIYGVTMEDKGVSKVLSLVLEEAEAYLEG